MSAYRTQRGFTLMEVLIASVLLGLMMLVLTGSLRVGADSWEGGEERLIRASRLYTVGHFLRQHIANQVPVSGVDEKGEMEASFHGTETTLSYIAPLPDQLEGGGLYRFKLYTRGEEDQRELRISIVPFQSAPDKNRTPPEPLDDLAIIDQVKNVRFAYFGASEDSPPSERSGKWWKEWRNYQLPTLIRINIERDGEDPWPTLVIAPKTLMLR